MPHTTLTPQRPDFTRVFCPYFLPIGSGKAAIPVYVKAEYRAGKLSLTGVEGPKRNGDAWGSCGQIPRAESYIPVNMTPAQVLRLWEIWDAWHLNDMRAGCEHQRADGWASRPIDPARPLNAYASDFYPGQRQASWNMLVWIPRSEHPEGLLSHPCPTCGYKYGSAWLKEDVPGDVLDELQALPAATSTPAWV